MKLKEGMTGGAYSGTKLYDIWSKDKQVFLWWKGKEKEGGKTPSQRGTDVWSCKNHSAAALMSELQCRDGSEFKMPPEDKRRCSHSVTGDVRVRHTFSYTVTHLMIYSTTRALQNQIRQTWFLHIKLLERTQRAVLQHAVWWLRTDLNAQQPLTGGSVHGKCRVWFGKSMFDDARRSVHHEKKSKLRL